MATQTKYNLGTTDPLPDDYNGDSFYTVADLVANGDLSGLRELADIGDEDAIAALAAV